MESECSGSQAVTYEKVAYVRRFSGRFFSTSDHAGWYAARWEAAAEAARRRTRKRPQLCRVVKQAGFWWVFTATKD